MTTLQRIINILVDEIQELKTKNQEQDDLIKDLYEWKRVMIEMLEDRE